MPSSKSDAEPGGTRPVFCPSARWHAWGKFRRPDGRGLGSPTSRSGASSGERDGCPGSWDRTRRYGRAGYGEFDRDTDPVLL